jgi:hypothetical protein
MSASRRTFLQRTLMTGGLIGLLESAASEPAFAQQLLASAAQANGDAGSGASAGKHDSKNFWDAFGAMADTSDAPPSGVHGRGLFKKPTAGGGGAAVASDRLIDYYHYYTDPKTKETSLRLATSIDPNELMDHEGDITASVNVNGFHMAGEDRQTFDQLQSAQLRIDMVQTQSMMPNYLDTMAWMSLAGLFPDKAGKLPPLQDLTFNPSSGGGKMNQMVLPGGSGQMAVNLSMTHKESLFYSVIKNLTSEVGRFSPLLGLPAISVTALKGFCSLYGALEQRTTFLLSSMPKAAYATQAARESAQTQSGLNLVPGDYVLVPNAHSAELASYLDKLEMRQGYLVPKGSPKTTSVYDLAASLKPDITYLSASISLKPLAAAPAPAPSRSSVPVSQPDAQDDSAPSKAPSKASPKPPSTAPAKPGAKPAAAKSGV